jgi:uncharacterized protein (DUF4415 family)
MTKRSKGKTDWGRLRATTDSEIEAQAVADPDHPILSDADWVNAVVEHPTKVQLTVRLDSSVVDWFRASGPGWQTRMGDVLRAYVTAKRAGSSHRQRDPAQTKVSGGRGEGRLSVKEGFDGGYRSKPMSAAGKPKVVKKKVGSVARGRLKR